MRFLFGFMCVLVLAVACGQGDSVPLCQEEGRGSSLLAACVSGPRVEEPTYFPPDLLEVRIEGVVEEMGQGGTSECFDLWYASLGDRIEADDPELDEARWVSFRTAEGELHRVEVIAPGGFQWSASVGESLVVDLSQRWRGFPPTVSSLEIRAKAEKLAYWMGVAWKLEELGPPDELELADGGEGCLVIGPDCNARWEERSLSASVDGETEVVDYGAQLSIGSLTVLNHAYEVQVGQVDCEDYFVGTAEVATWPK
ncbi:MAG TPA: hypothetical protein VFG22_04420 [Polyangiales bacterium]|nr:hypothetical protein [Polyangiales bacterium]